MSKSLGCCPLKKEQMCQQSKLAASCLFQVVTYDIKWYSKWRTRFVLEALWSVWRYGKEQAVSVEYVLLLDN